MYFLISIIAKVAGMYTGPKNMWWIGLKATEGTWKWESGNEANFTSWSQKGRVHV